MEREIKFVTKSRNIFQDNYFQNVMLSYVAAYSSKVKTFTQTLWSYRQRKKVVLVY